MIGAILEPEQRTESDMDVTIALKLATWDNLTERGVLSERTSERLAALRAGKSLTDDIVVPMRLGAAYTLISRLERTGLQKTARLIDEQVSR